jgi:hypothetical protein
MARLHDVVRAFADVFRDDGVRLPDRWQPKQIERNGTRSDG